MPSRRGVWAQRDIPAPRDRIFAFLSDLENHWLLADRFVEVLEIQRTTGGEARGGAVRMRGPLGLSRTVRTSVVEVEPPSGMIGTAEIGDRTKALVRWSLAATTPQTTLVGLGAEVERTSSLDRLLLAAGGRLWLGSRFAKVLATLEQRIKGTV